MYTGFLRSACITRTLKRVLPDDLIEASLKVQPNVLAAQRVEIEFAELSDGSQAEVIQSPADPTKSLLAVYKDGSVQCVEQWHDGNRILVPFPREGEMLKHIILPVGSEPYGGLEELTSDVTCFFGACLDVEPKWQMLMTGFVLSGWFPEKLPVAPYLALLGPPGSGKTTAMRILSLLCRRGLLTSDITSAGFYDVCHRLGPTLLIDETATAGHSRTLLRSSSTPGFVSLRKDKARMAYGPKVLAFIEMPDDAAFNSRCIIIPLCKTTRTDLKAPNDPNVLRFAEKVRMRLQQFRFEHYRSLSVPKVPTVARLCSRALDLYRALALPFGANQEFCELLACLIAAQRPFQSRLISENQSSAVRVLYTFIHDDSSAAGLKLRGLTAGMNLDLASRGEPSKLNERKVGDILTSLGLTNRSRTNAGYVLCLERADRVRIHKIARDYDVEGTGRNQDCDMCKEAKTASPTNNVPEAADEKLVGSDAAKREDRELRNVVRRSLLELQIGAPKGGVRDNVNRGPGDMNRLLRVRKTVEFPCNRRIWMPQES
jgi:hypothetical protein